LRVRILHIILRVIFICRQRSTQRAAVATEMVVLLTSLSTRQVKISVAAVLTVNYNPMQWRSKVGA